MSALTTFKWRHGALCSLAHSTIMFYCECLLKYWQWITCNFSCERHTKGSSTTLDSPSGWKSSPGKIFHWNSYDARTSIWNSVRATPTAAKTTLSTERQRLQRLQTFTETATKYYNYTANETDEERDHQLLTLQDNNNSRRKRWGEATLEVYIQTYLLRYNDRQKKFTTTRPKKCTRGISFQRTEDSRSAFWP